MYVCVKRVDNSVKAYLHNKVIYTYTKIYVYIHVYAYEFISLYIYTYIYILVYMVEDIFVVVLL
jgi:hypothetical protein